MRTRILLLALAAALTAGAQVPDSLYAGLRWRNIGPFRAGRVSAVTGVIGRPGTFYIGLPAGGVWMTDDAGGTWNPIFDSVPGISSIGAIEVAPSNPQIIYAATGDLITGGAVNEGDGVYKSTDGGKTWHHSGLEKTHQIDTLLVDPHNPDIVLAAAQGDVHHTGEDRGIYRSTDGGATWQRVMFRNDATGAQDMGWAYDHPSVIFATTVRHFNPVLTDEAPAAAGRGARAGGGARGAAGGAENDTALYKSTDEGVTWTEVQGGGLPALTGRTSVAVASNTNGQRVYLVGGFGMYRSDDGGATWTKATNDTRITGSAYICGVYVDPKNPDVVYNMQTSTYRSTDGGHTWISWKGAPGGDDNHVLWIDPTDSDRVLLGSDQGATITYNGGKSWSTWYNQATVQVYTIGVDNGYPYWVYGIQQDSDAIAVRDRGDLGAITPLDWYPLPAWETGAVAVDPTDNNVIYAGANNGGLSRIVAPSYHWQYIGPQIGATDLRRTTNQVIVFSPQDPHTMYFATQYLLATKDQGNHWTKMSPDLAARAGTAAPPAGGRGGGAIESIAPSPVARGTIWVGSSNGLVHVTKDDGGNWSEVSPPGLHAWSNIEVEASHFDAATAYASVDQHTGGDYTPHVYRTRDGGKTWQTIVTGLPSDEPSGSFVRMIKEDTVRKGLLFAGSESSVYVSLDDGDHWQSLRLNLPNTSYRDMRVHGQDLVVGTYGRSFWVLDDLTPLRQISAQIASEPVHLFKPGDAIRAMRDVNLDTPLTPEQTLAENPPYGAIIYYYLSKKPTGDIKLEILDSQQRLVRTYSSAPPNMPWFGTPTTVPDYWKQPLHPLPTEIGTNRFNWDMHFEPPPAMNHDYGRVFQAIVHDTVPSPEGPFAIPGDYTVRLTVDGKSYAQALHVVNDPREGQTAAKMTAMRAQLDLELKISAVMSGAMTSYDQIAALRASLRDLTSANLPPDVAAAATALDAKLAARGGAGGGRRGGGGGAGPAPAAGGAPAIPAFATLDSTLSGFMFAIQGETDAAPTEPQQKAFHDYCGQYNAGLADWKSMAAQDLPALNAQLTKANHPTLTAPAPPAAVDCGPAM